jgi:hypothetical protein
MGFVFTIKLTRYPHQKNMKVDKKDAPYVQFLLKPQIFDVLAVTRYLEENQDQTKNYVQWKFLSDNIKF